MKSIEYKIGGYVGIWNPETEEVEQRECLAEVSVPYTEANEERAKAGDHNGGYTIEDDGQPEPASPVTWAALAAAYKEGVDEA